MGNTCSSVHIALTGATLDAIEGIVRAYATLGFERAKTAPPEGGKHVVLLRKEGDAFVSVYDSDNTTLDTGDLKALALATSKIALREDQRIDDLELALLPMLPVESARVHRVD
jgi:hypothetical protein